MVNNVPMMYGQMDDSANIPRGEYEELRERSAFLAALEQVGVENWEGYEEAQDLILSFNEDEEGTRD